MADRHGRHGITRSRTHQYLQGNFAPIDSIESPTPCDFLGTIPGDLIGGQYVRNGANPTTNSELGRDAHWFDGDGMLSGVFFKADKEKGLQPEYLNQYVLTDVYLAAEANPKLRVPILPSIATLINPRSSLIWIVSRIFRLIYYILRSYLVSPPGPIKKISVANTSIIHHDGRVLATCESGPPMRVSLPDLRTVGWFNGWRADGEPEPQGLTPGPESELGGRSLTGFLKEWTTGHPRKDPHTQELILFHSTVIAPFVHYSVIPTSGSDGTPAGCAHPMLNVPVPGMKAPKMMHDFCVSRKSTIIIDFPLTLDPMNLLHNKPVIDYDSDGCTRFGVFPRHTPSQVRWFETKPCCIFHTVNTWDEVDKPTNTVIAVSTLVCRMKSPAMVFTAGNIPPPASISTAEDECRLYYFKFDLSTSSNTITHQWALSAIPFELSHVPKHLAMSATRFVYGCTLAQGTYTAALGRATKIDCLVKLDVGALIEKSLQQPPVSVTGCVDNRSVLEVLASKDPKDPIKIFQMPAGWYAQEPGFVPRKDGTSEDDGWILSFVFDESQLDEEGNAPADARSELWVIDAKGMQEVVARILLPQRVPYGLHGAWFPREEIQSQRPVERYRKKST
ncbi:carotenoid cleavage dioxygenase 1 [Penicillium sp. DV-2018c]|nr:carotenoid cleavage dioxygenase 1 [Penicillium sp. DV-2018c]